MTRTLPLHAIPADRMKKLTQSGQETTRSTKVRDCWERFKTKHIVMDDPRSQNEQRQDEADPDRADVGYVIAVACLIVILCVGWALINR